VTTKTPEGGRGAASYKELDRDEKTEEKNHDFWTQERPQKKRVQGWKNKLAKANIEKWAKNIWDKPSRVVTTETAKKKGKRLTG